MTSIERRTFLRLAAAASATPLLGALACGPDDEQDRTFPQGVGSGDPASDGVLLWTRVEPVESDSVEHVHYEVAADPDFKQLVEIGDRDVDADTDHALRLEIS